MGFNFLSKKCKKKCIDNITDSMGALAPLSDGSPMGNNFYCFFLKNKAPAGAGELELCWNVCKLKEFSTFQWSDNGG